MKILYYSPHPQLSIHAPTGYGTHMREMVASWRKMGIEVKTLIAGDIHARKYGAPVAPKKVKWWRIKRFIPPLIWETLRDIKLIRFDKGLEGRLREAVSEFEPDLIYERVAYLQNSGVKVAKALGVRHISEINAPYPEERVSFSGKSLMLGTARDNERQILIETSGISVVSTALAEYFMAKLPNIADKIRVVPNCVNPDEVVHNTARMDELRKEFDLTGKSVIGFVGSIFPYHGVNLMIAAFSDLPESVRGKMLIVGDGSSLPELKAHARRAGVFSDVIFTGSVPHRDVYAYIELMDVCCMARSNWYGSPVKLFEYGLLKKPVIAPDVLPVRDVMDSETAELVSPDVEELRKAMIRLLTDETRRKEIAEKWHHKVLKEHTWEVAARKILELCA